MRIRSVLAACAALFLVMGAADAAEVVASVFRELQLMIVSVDGVPKYAWDVSTGRRDEWTPLGTYHPTSAPQRMHYSRLYHHAPMPFTVFFDGGRAVHGIPVSEVPLLGTRASHGCVRLETAHAEIFYNLVLENGIEHTTIVLQ